MVTDQRVAKKINSGNIRVELKLDDTRSVKELNCDGDTIDVYKPNDVTLEINFKSNSIEEVAEKISHLLRISIEADGRSR